MPNSQDHRFAQLDAMSEDQLQQILREDASKPEGEDTDMEQLLYIMEVLATRRQQRGEGSSPAEALDSFHEHYSTVSEPNLISDTERTPARKLTFRPWLRIAAAAAVLVLVLGSSVRASAWDFDFWDIIAKWTQETFHFGYAAGATEPSGPVMMDGTVYSGLLDALDKVNISATLIPTWMPDGFEETKMEIYENPKQRRIYAEYRSDDNIISIQIRDHLGKDPSHAEQSDTPLEVYILDGIEYYILSNYNELRAVWIVGSCEYQISCTTSVDDIKLMIDSIGSKENEKG